MMDLTNSAVLTEIINILKTFYVLLCLGLFAYNGRFTDKNILPAKTKIIFMAA